MLRKTFTSPKDKLENDFNVRKMEAQNKLQN